MALDLGTGAVKWVSQVTSGDAYNMACGSADQTNCPEKAGPDHDFGQSAILVPLGNGKRALVAGQKSGVVHAFDPDDRGRKLWSVTVGKGGMLGHGGVVVFDDRVDLAKQARFAFDFCAIESCGKCTTCRIGSTRGRETMDKVLNGQKTVSNITLVRDLCETMRDGSLCALGGLIPMPVMSAIEHFPEDFDRKPHPAAAE